MSAGRFDWDDAKAQKNLRKHGIAFEFAQEALDDPLGVTVVDPIHSYGETRYATLGCTVNGELLVVVNTSRDGRLRIISARRATKAEIRRYMNRDTDRIHDEEFDDVLPEYDFSNGVRGMFAPKGPVHHYRIDADIAEYFPTGELLNETLRALIAEGRIRKPETPVDAKR